MASKPDPNAHTEVAPLGGPSENASIPSPIETMGAGDAPLVAGRYRILGMLGAGGMGTVYRARDLELDELVALKMLKKELAAAPGMLDRFRREVKLARRVTDRGVARMFDIGEHEGDRFLTMELVQGENLGAYLAKRRRLSVADTVRIARDVASGLSAAHAADVLHRDLKPENVIVTPDRGAVITDFGIARAVAEAERGRTVGGIVGTPAYMAPEQVEGLADLDGRTDLYALGVMIYELATGAMPWNGDTAFAIAAARLLRPPPDPRAIVPDLPAPFAELVLSLMARDRNERPITAGAVIETLATLLPDGPISLGVPRPSASSASLRAASLSPSPAFATRQLAARKSVAVLPILNLAAAEDLILADTLTEDIVDILSTTSGLRVRPRGETKRHVDSDRDAREIGRTHGVDVIVDGTLRRIGATLRMSVRLVTVEDGFQLWAGRYERRVEQILNVVPDVATEIARALASEIQAHAAPIVADAQAQEMLLRARNMLYRASFRVAQEAIDLLREARSRAPDDTRIAGTYALALARAAASSTGSAALVDEARRISDQVLAVNPSQPQAVVALAFIHLTDIDLDAVCVHLNRANRLAPNSVEALEMMGRLLLESKRVETGMKVLSRAFAIDPEITLARHTIARVHALLGDHDAFLEMLGKVPKHPYEQIGFFLTIGRVACWQADRAVRDDFVSLLRAEGSAEAQEAVKVLVSIVTTSTISAADIAAMDRALPVADTTFSRRRVAFHGQLRCELMLSCGMIEPGIAELKLATDNGLNDLLWLDKCPLLDRIRSRSEFADVHRQVEVRAKRVAEILDPALSI